MVVPWRRKWQPTHLLAYKIPWTEEPGRAMAHRIAEGWTQLSIIVVKEI